MKEILEQLTSPSFLIFGVLLAIVINIISNRADKRIDKLLKRREAKTEAQRALFNEEVARLRASDIAQRHCLAKIMQEAVLSTICFVLGCLQLALSMLVIQTYSSNILSWQALPSDLRLDFGLGKMNSLLGSSVPDFINRPGAYLVLAFLFIGGLIFFFISIKRLDQVNLLTALIGAASEPTIEEGMES